MQKSRPDKDLAQSEPVVNPFGSKIVAAFDDRVLGATAPDAGSGDEAGNGFSNCTLMV
jgi:hypothetical protein